MKKTIFYLLLTVSLASCLNSGTSKDPNSSVTNTPVTAGNISDTAEIDTNWTYQEDEDKMTSKKTYLAYTQAKELLQFDFPYDGGATAVLVLRKKRGSTDVYLKISQGQFHGSYDDKKVKVRFDGLPAYYNSYGEASDGSSDVIFLDNEKSFINLLKNHKTLLIEAEFYQAGLKQMEFDISNLKWDH